MLEVTFTKQENKITVRHSSKLKVTSRMKSVTAIATACPAIANHLRFIRVLGFIQLSFKYISLLIKSIIYNAKVLICLCVINILFAKCP